MAAYNEELDGPMCSMKPFCCIGNNHELVVFVYERKRDDLRLR